MLHRAMSYGDTWSHSQSAVMATDQLLPHRAMRYADTWSHSKSAVMATDQLLPHRAMRYADTWSHSKSAVMIHSIGVKVHQICFHAPIITHTAFRVKYPWKRHFSLVPRPHPLTRRNGLVNQVEFLGLAGALATV